MQCGNNLENGHCHYAKGKTTWMIETDYLMC